MVLRTRSPKRAAFLSVILMIAASVAIQAYLIWNSYFERWDGAARSADTIMSIVSADIERNLNVIDRALLALTNTLEQAELSRIPDEVRSKLLFSGLSAAEYVGASIVLSKEGDILYDSAFEKPRQRNLSDRPYFKFHRENVGKLFIAGPYTVESRGGEKVFILSRGIYGADGAFNGEVVVSLKINYFLKIFEHVEIGVNDYIALVDKNGRIIARDPSLDGKGDIGREVKDHPILGRMMEDTSLKLTAVTPLDGVRRHFLARQLAGYPLVLVVGFSTQEVMAPWMTRAVLLGVLALLTAAIGIWLVIALQRSMTQQYAVEAELQSLAATDALTGLANRRAFDGYLEREWLRAGRDGTSLALLLVDLDRFKVVNDTLGHSAGDDLLRLVADQIDSSIHRATDLVARYGGEEFAVILPATNLSGAMVIAERLRTDIERATAAFRAYGEAVGTASIGVAVAMPKRPAEMAGLLAAADRALYQAKENGRNRVCAVGANNTPGQGSTAIGG